MGCCQGTCRNKISPFSSLERGMSNSPVKSTGHKQQGAVAVKRWLWSHCGGNCAGKEQTYKLQEPPAMPSAASTAAPPLSSVGTNLSLPNQVANKFDNMQTCVQVADQVANELASKGFSLEQLLMVYIRYLKLGRFTEATETWQIVRDVVIPETSFRRCCFMDIMEGGPQQPEKLVSHWWGSTFKDIVLAIAQDASGLSGSSLESKMHQSKFKVEVLSQTYWLCIFAVNQHTAICGTDSNPCNCGSEKYTTGHPLCQVDKFDIVLQKIPGGIIVVLDDEMKTLTRVWVLAEIGSALHYKKRIRFLGNVPEQVRTAKRTNSRVQIPKVEECEATVPEDKALILKKISNSVGFDEFNDLVSEEIFEGVYVLLKEATKRAENRIGSLFVTSRYHRGKDVSEDYIVSRKPLESKDKTAIDPQKGGNETVQFREEVKIEFATNRITGEKVRIKTLSLKEVGKAKIKQIADYTEVLLSVHHPHIVALIDAYEMAEGNSIAFVTEHLTGPTLVDHFLNKSIFSEFDIATAAHQMLRAIRYLHSYGLVQGDLTLESFTYEQSDSNVLKLNDVGCCQIKDLNTKMASLCGTLAYLSPEVLEQSYNPKCDLWSIGVIVFILLSGMPPFVGSEEEMLKAIKEGLYTMRPEYWSEVSRDGVDFVQSLLTREVEQRSDAEQALKHIWIYQRDQLHSALIDSGVIGALNSFAEASRFRRACMQTMAWSLSQKERQEIRNAFMSIDSDGNGFVSFSELKCVLAEFNNDDVNEPNQPTISSCLSKSNTLAAEKMMDKMDADSDRQINYLEFLAAAAYSRVEMHADLIKDTFRRFDVDNSGQISVHELCAVLGDAVTHEEAELMIAEVDLDGNGEIDYKEFLMYMRGFSQGTEKRKQSAVSEDRRIEILSQLVDAKTVRGWKHVRTSFNSLSALCHPIQGA